MRRMGNTRNVFWPEATGVAVCEAAAAASLTSVSYTHLRAHETDSYLVCRLLLEKKNNNNYL